MAEAAEEGEHGGGDGDVFWRGGGLDREGHGGEEKADADAGDQHQENPSWDGGRGREEVEQAGAQGGQGPAEPERPAVVACFSGDDADDRRARDDSQGLRERRDSGKDWGEILRAFEEKRHVIEDGPEDDTVDPGEEVGDVGVFVSEYSKREEGVGRKLGFINDKEGETKQADDDGNEGVPA